MSNAKPLQKIYLYHDFRELVLPRKETETTQRMFSRIQQQNLSRKGTNISIAGTIERFQINEMNRR